MERIHEGKKRCSQNKTILVKKRKTIHQCKVDKWQVFEQGAKRTAVTVDNKKGMWKKYPWHLNCKNDIKM